MNNPNQAIDDKYLEMAVRIVTAATTATAGQSMLNNPSNAALLLRTIAFELRDLHNGESEPPKKA